MPSIDFYCFFFFLWPKLQKLQMLKKKSEKKIQNNFPSTFCVPSLFYSLFCRHHRVIRQWTSFPTKKSYDVYDLCWFWWCDVNRIESMKENSTLMMIVCVFKKKNFSILNRNSLLWVGSLDRYYWLWWFSDQRKRN